MRRIRHPRATARSSGLPSPRPTAGEIAKLLASVRQFPEARRSASSAPMPLRKAQRLICRCCARPGGSGRSSSTAPWFAWTRSMEQFEGVDAARWRSATADRRGNLAQEIIVACAFGARRSVGAPVRRPGRRVRLRLDAHSRPRSPTRGGAAAGHLGSHRRLGRTDLDQIAELAPSEVSGSPTVDEGALARWCRLAGIPARALAMVGYDKGPRGPGAQLGARSTPLGIR